MPRRATPRRCWPGSGARSSAAPWGSTRTSSISAAIRCWRRGWPRGCGKPSASSCRLRRLFERPTVAALAVSDRGGARRGGAPGGAAASSRRRATGPLPLSFAQRRLWFLDQLSPGSAVYNIPHPLALDGRARSRRPAARASTRWCGRHEALRTTFPGRRRRARPGDRSPAGPLPAARRRSRGPGRGGAATREAARLAARGGLRPFDLGAGPAAPGGAAAARRASEHVLLLTMHHIVSDGWSMEILLRELMALYEAFAAGLPSPLPELPVQYADFAVWQRRWLTGEALARQLDYWRAPARRRAGGPRSAHRPPAAGGADASAAPPARSRSPRSWRRTCRRSAGARG